jgi:hypothetical protein
MKDKELFVAYVHSVHEWRAWIYSYGELIKKLGIFTTKQEAANAVEQWKEESKYGDS